MPKEALLEYYALTAVKSGTPHQLNGVAEMAASADYSKYFRRTGKKMVLRGTVVVGGSEPKVHVY